MTEREPYVAIALLTPSELEGVGDALRYVVLVDDMPSDFHELLAKIDEVARRPN